MKHIAKRLSLICLGAWLLSACQVGSGVTGPQPSQNPVATASPPGPCIPEAGCQVMDATVHQVVQPEKACAGDRLKLELSNLNNVLSPAEQIDLLLVFDPNANQQLPPGDKGTPPRFDQGTVVLASAEVSAEGTAMIEVLLQSEYGPDEQGRQLLLKPGQSNALLYLNMGNSYYGVQTQLCPAESNL